MDCEKLSPSAQKIFDEIKKFYPPDPWSNPRYKDEGLVCDNGWRDLRKSEDRNKLLETYEHQIGTTIVTFATVKKDKGERITRSVFSFKMSKSWIELAVLLRELDFQIGTLDLVEY